MNKTIQSFAGCTLLQLLCALPSIAATISMGTSTPGVGDGVQNLNFSTSAADDTAVQFIPSNYLAGDNSSAVGQTFTTGSNAGGYSLSGISVRQLSSFQTFWDFTGGSLTIQIFQVNSTGSGISNITQLALETVTVGGEPDGIGLSSGTQGANASWLTIDLGTSLSLAANTQYGFQLVSDGTGGNDGFFMELDGTNTNPYSGGFAIGTGKVGGMPDANLVWDGNNGQPSDRAFVATMTAVPEPASAMLGAFGMLLLLRRRQR